MPANKIAIYTGTVPGTVFIERLIEGLAAKGNPVYLFGKMEKRRHYSKNVKLVTHSSKLQKLFMLLWYAELLFLFRNTEKKKLDAIIKNKKGSANKLKLKYYPVLYHRPEVFHLQWAKGVEEWMWVKEFGIKLVVSLRGTHIAISPIADQQLSETYKSCFPRVDGFHAVSKAMAGEAIKYGADPERIKTVYSGFDLTPFDKKNEKGNTNSRNNKNYRILSIGRAHWVKGYHYALDACFLLQENGLDFNYTIIGLEENEELLFQRHQHGLQERVIFKGKAAFESIVAEIREADILLLPSVEEGIANVVLEAMALGTLVIATDCGGMGEVIKDKENGFLVPARDPEALARAIMKARALTEEEYKLLTDNARQLVERQHNETQMVSGMETLYEMVLQANDNVGLAAHA